MTVMHLLNAMGTILYVGILAGIVLYWLESREATRK